MKYEEITFSAWIESNNGELVSKFLVFNSEKRYGVINCLELIGVSCSWTKPYTFTKKRKANFPLSKIELRTLIDKYRLDLGDFMGEPILFIERNEPLKYTPFAAVNLNGIDVNL